MKYQFQIDKIDLSTSHGKLLGQVADGATVLECGCASGYMTKYMKEQLNCKVSIIEYEKEAYDIALEYSVDGFCGDMNEDEWLKYFEGKKFDFIICADVLEHLINPQEVLCQLSSLLEDDGTLLVSLPNVCHNDILMHLFFNDWNYQEKGLLDNSHIRFFGRENLAALFEKSGLKITILDYVNMPTGRSEQFWHCPCNASDKLLDALSDRQLGEVYQFVITGRKAAFCEENHIELRDMTESAKNASGLNSIYDYRDMYIESNKKLDNLEIKYWETESLCLKYKQNLEQTTNTLRKLQTEYTYTKDDMEKIVNSRCFRLIKKYYAVREVLLPNGSRRFKVVKTILFPAIWLYRHLHKKPVDDQKAIVRRSPDEIFDCLKYYGRIDVLAIDHTAFVAKLLQEKIRKAGLECEIHLNEMEQYEDLPYILVCPQCYKKFPEIYIAFQMEQTVSPRWMTEEYFDILRSAYAVFDYSLVNIEYFSKDPLIAPKLYYMPIDLCLEPLYKPVPDAQKEYDVLFYGSPFVSRRKEMLDRIGEKYSVKIISDLFGEPLYREIEKAKIVINIHYYEDALLETTRIYETLSLNTALIISEKSNDPAEEERLKGFVDFVEIGDTEAMTERIGYWLSHEKERVQKVKENGKMLQIRPNATLFYVYRFLLANDIIKFDKFYKEVADFVSIEGDRYCLSLPETTERRGAFDADNKYGFRVFPGLRHYYGWIGCAMSYKFIAKRATDAHLDELLVCEDDVYFPPDFSKRFGKVLKHLNGSENWDVYCGIMADLTGISVRESHEYDGEVYVTMNKMISMVFNMYRRNVLSLMSDWNPEDRNVDVNTIDRFLSSQATRVWTTCPFLVGHKEDLQSTIWGRKNDIYTDLIEESSKKLRTLVEQNK